VALLSRLRSPEPLRVDGTQPLDTTTKEVTIDGLSVAIAIYAACVALLAAIGFALRRPRSPLLDKLVLVLEGALVVRAMLGVGAMVSGAHPYPGVTHVAYLLTSVGLLPVMVATLADDRSHWSTAVVGVACLALVVIAIRVEMTWSGHA
jgi:heme A synthase